MNLIRTTSHWDNTDADPAAVLRTWLIPGCWTIEAGHQPPPCHDSAGLPCGNDPIGGAAISLCSASIIGLTLGPALIVRLAELGATLDPLAGLALHELIVNAVTHGNLQVASGRSQRWQDLARRQAAIDQALADPARAARMVTIALFWRARDAVAVIADEGDGYDPDSLCPPARGAGRGLPTARLIGRISLLCGGRQTMFVMNCAATPASGR